jgi:glycosyltransferase involved in cell wall biosynthesis
MTTITASPISIPEVTPSIVTPSIVTPSTGITRLPTVSIIIPAYDEEDVIERCVLAALDQSVPAHEILVVDNRSTDGTAEIVRRLASGVARGRVRLVEQHETQGLVPTRNAGFAAATGEILGRIDADTVIDHDWTRRVSEHMRDPEVGAVTGPVSYYDLPHAGWGGRADDLARRTFRHLGTRYPFLYGSNMAIRATAWSRIAADACIDEEDRFHEDIDVAVHLFDAGIRAAYEPAMRAGVSARRLDDAPADFRDYTKRFERTYASHGIDFWYLKAPQVLLESLYWPLRWGRRLHLTTRTAA